MGKGYLEDFENFILQLAEGRLITFSPYKDTSLDIKTPFKFDIGWFELNSADKIKITDATTKTLKQKVYELGIRTGRVDLMSYKNSKGNADASKLSINIKQKNDNVYTYVYAYNQSTHKSNRLGKVENGKPLTIKDEKDEIRKVLFIIIIIFGICLLSAVLMIVFIRPTYVSIGNEGNSGNNGRIEK